MLVYLVNSYSLESGAYLGSILFAEEARANETAWELAERGLIACVFKECVFGS